MHEERRYKQPQFFICQRQRQQCATNGHTWWGYVTVPWCFFFLAPSRARKQYRLPWSIAVQWCGCNILLLLLLCEMSLFSHISAQSYAKMYVGVQRREGRQLQATLLLLVNLLVCISRCCQIILCNLFIPLWYAHTKVWFLRLLQQLMCLQRRRDFIKIKWKKIGIKKCQRQKHVFGYFTLIGEWLNASQKS